MQSSTSNNERAPNEPPQEGIMNTTNDYEEETSTSSQENDGQVMPILMLGSQSVTIQKLTDSEIRKKENKLFKVCKKKDWDTFQKFLSDETISRDDKKLILKGKYFPRCCTWPIVMGAHIALIQNIIDCLEDLFFDKIGDRMFEEALDWSIDGEVRKYPDFKYTTVSYEVIELLLSKGGPNLVYSSKCLGIGSPVFQKYLGLNGECPRIINLLLEKCGLDLLELQDDYGDGILEFTNRTQRDIITDYLRGLDSSPTIQKHIESLTKAGVSPKEFFDWIDNYQFDRVRDYLDDEEVPQETKVECFTTYSVYHDLPFHKFCERHGPVDIAKRFVDIMGPEVWEWTALVEYTCLHSACSDIYDAEMGFNIKDLKREDFERHHDLIEFILSKTGWKLLLETNEFGISALRMFMICLRTDLKCVKLVMSLGGKELLDYQEDGNTILHLASEREIIDVEVIKYLVSIGGPKLIEAKNRDGKKAERMWPSELREYIDRSMNPLPAFYGDLKCSICFDIMNDVHIITKCCHRFCKSCITQTKKERGNTCPLCRAEFTFHSDIMKDPLLDKFAKLAKEKDDRVVSLQSELSEAMLREQVQEKQISDLCNELLNLRRKYSEI